MPKITIYLPEKTVEDMDAKLEGRSRSLVIRKLVEQWNEGKTKIDWRAE